MQTMEMLLEDEGYASFNIGENAQVLMQLTQLIRKVEFGLTHQQLIRLRLALQNALAVTESVHIPRQRYAVLPTPPPSPPGHDEPDPANCGCNGDCIHGG